ncbi:MAG: M23 family peptidase, partial [Clostridia bacterium]|nr:M23 family peptidase [Clostridia bacterium]
GGIIGLEGGAKTDPNPGTSTGHHLHFEIRTASGNGHSIDPTKYIEF